MTSVTVFLRVDAVWGHKLLIRALLGVSYLVRRFTLVVTDC